MSAYPNDVICGEIVMRTALLALKYIFRDDLRERLPAILRLLTELAQKRSGLEYVETVLRYVS